MKDETWELVQMEQCSVLKLLKRNTWDGLVVKDEEWRDCEESKYKWN